MQPGATRPLVALLAAAVALWGCGPADSVDRSVASEASEASAPSVASAPSAPSVASAPSADAQVEEALLPLPEGEREGATVLGYDVDGTLVTLREGEGRFRCLADDPADPRFHVACYHESLEPYMARGRELRAEGLSEREAISHRWEEIEAGTLAFPSAPAALFSLHAEGREALSAAPGEGGREAAGEEGPRRLTVIYVRGATAEETGLPTRPEAGLPWLMMPGSPTAHVMIHD